MVYDFEYVYVQVGLEGEHLETFSNEFIDNVKKTLMSPPCIVQGESFH